MSVVVLKKWGNSAGVLIPAADIKQAHAYIGEKFEIIIKKNGSILLQPKDGPRAGWKAAFDAATEKGNENLLEDINNDFDRDEWTW